MRREVGGSLRIPTHICMSAGMTAQAGCSRRESSDHQRIRSAEQEFWLINKKIKKGLAFL